MTTVYSCPCGESTEETKQPMLQVRRTPRTGSTVQATEDDIERSCCTFVKVWIPTDFSMTNR